MQDFKRLHVWHKAHSCFLSFYRAFGTGTTRTGFSIRRQTLDAAASIPANIAEGCGKSTTKEFLRFLDISISSPRELENHLIVVRDIALVSREKFTTLHGQLSEVQRMLVGLIRALKAQPPRENA
jgi:four helix bundle protein